MAHARSVVRRARPVALVVLVAACGPRVAPAPTPTPTPAGTTCAAPTSPAAGLVADVFARVNAERASSGLAPLAWDAQLSCAAQTWSATMASTGVFGHQDLASIGGTPAYRAYRTLGENIARGPGTMSGSEIVAAWMASSAHAANIRSASFGSVGIGTAVAVDGTRFVSAVFGG